MTTQVHSTLFILRLGVSAAAAVSVLAFTFSRAAPIPRMEKALTAVQYWLNSPSKVKAPDDDLHLDGSLVPALIVAVGPNAPSQPKFFVGDDRVMLTTGSPDGMVRLGSIRPAAGQQLTQWTASAVSAVQYYWKDSIDPSLDSDDWTPMLSFGDGAGNGLVVTPEVTVLVKPDQPAKTLGLGVPVTASDGNRLTLEEWFDFAARHLARTYLNAGSSKEP